MGEGEESRKIAIKASTARRIVRGNQLLGRPLLRLGPLFVNYQYGGALERLARLQRRGPKNLPGDEYLAGSGALC
jgi:hypothetical protein